MHLETDSGRAGDVRFVVEDLESVLEPYRVELERIRPPGSESSAR